MEKENKKPGSLPTIKEQRFSTWNQSQNHLSDLDELLIEQVEQEHDLKEDSFDFDNSAELDRIISKYESQLDLKEERSFEEIDVDQVEREVAQLSLAPKNEVVKKEEDDDDKTIDEFIKQHLDETEKKKTEKEKHYDSLSDSDSSGHEALTPRQSLLSALLRLSAADDSDKTYSSLNERELFIFDLEQILKVLTFKEVCLLVFPCLEIFAVEQEYLKIELFRQLPHVFAKVMRSEAKVNGEKLSEDQLLDILTVNLFPLISQLLMISDESVQTEGIKALLTVCKDKIMNQEDAVFLIHNVLQILFKKADTLDNARVGALMLMETFVREGYFGKEIVDLFMKDNLAQCLADNSFKTKRPLLQTLITISKHLSKDQVSKQVFQIFKKFAHPSEVWGLRRLCLTLAPEMAQLIDPSDTEAFKFILEFLSKSLKKVTDQGSSEKWVRNQALTNFGPIIHATHLKTMNKPQIAVKITEVCNAFYDLEFLKAEKGNSSQESFMPEDDSDKIKEMWAYHMPCVLLVQKAEYWPKLKPIYQEIYTDAASCIKRSLAAAVVDIAKINLDEPFMTQVILSFTSQDNEDVRAKVFPNIIQYIKLCSPAEKQLYLLGILIRPLLDESKKTTLQQSQMKAQLLKQLFTQTGFNLQLLVDQQYHTYLQSTIKQDSVIHSRKVAAKAFGSSVLPQFFKQKKYRESFNIFLNELRTSRNFRDRQMYIYIAKASYKTDPEIFKKHFAKAIGQDLINEKVKVVQIALAKLTAKVQPGFSRSNDKVREFLLQSAAPDVKQFLVKQNQLQFIDVSKLKVQLKDDDNKSEVTPTPDRDAELDSLQQHEKTVNIRFANYSMLMRASQYGISSKLLLLLGGVGGTPKAKEVVDQAEEKLLKPKDTWD